MNHSNADNRKQTRYWHTLKAKALPSFRERQSQISNNLDPASQILAYSIDLLKATATLPLNRKEIKNSIE